MRKLKKIGKIIVALLLLIAMALLVVVYTLKPKYSGEKKLVNLSNQVEVYYDTYGIPHIYGKNEIDAYRAFGYVHAQDRLWQMEILRRIASGRLSEVFGEKLIGTDKFFLALGIDEESIKAANALDKKSETYALSQAYLDGINQFLNEGPTPVEFYLTGVEKKPFTLKDIYNTMGYMAFSFAMAHKTDPLLSNVKNELGDEYVNDLLFPNKEFPALILKNHKTEPSDSVKNNIVATVNKALGALAIPLFEGSNSWVISPEKTKNSKVIFANDPHIGFSQPSVWYEAHLSSPTYEKYGYHLGGVPFPLLAHDRNLAYGMTMFENDDVDFYYEKQHPTDSTKYKSDTIWKTYEVKTKTIKVKDIAPVSFTYKKTERGPVLNGIMNQIDGEKNPISMWWTYTNVKNEVMDAVYEMSHAENITQFQNALPKIHAPGLSIMYGDAKGNVGRWGTAKLYEIPDSTNTKLILPYNAKLGTSKQYLDFNHNPSAINPPWKYVYSANNQQDSVTGSLYPGYYLPDNRAKRIVSLLEPKNDWTKNEVSKMIIDANSPVHTAVITDLQKLIDFKAYPDIRLDVLDKLYAWNGENQIDNVEPTIYHAWIYSILKNTFKDELGNEKFEQLLSTHLVKKTIAPIITKENSVWWDNTKTDTLETKKHIINTSLIQAVSQLEKRFGKDVSGWKWRKVHTLEHEHPIGQVDALRSFFNVGPFAVNGTREVINNMGFTYTENGNYKVGSGPSTRRIIDFSDIENSLSILPTGQSGNPFSKHYEDQATMYNNGEFRKMMLNEKGIKSTSKSLLIFTTN